MLFRYFAATATQLIDGLHAQKVITLKDRKGSDEKNIANTNLALHGGKPLFPLSKGVSEILFGLWNANLLFWRNRAVRYPIYDGYPKQIIDLQIQERSKVLAMEREITRRESSLKALQLKLAETEDEHSKWMAAHARGSEAELKYRKEMMVSFKYLFLWNYYNISNLLQKKEKQYLLQLQRIEEEVVQTLLNIVAAMSIILFDILHRLPGSDCLHWSPLNRLRKKRSF